MGTAGVESPYHREGVWEATFVVILFYVRYTLVRHKVTVYSYWQVKDSSNCGKLSQVLVSSSAIAVGLLGASCNSGRLSARVPGPS